MTDETPTPSDGDLDFLRGALSDDAHVEPNLWMIRQKISAKRRKKIMVRSASVTAAALALVAAGYSLGTHAPRPAGVPVAGTGDAEYLQAAVAQLTYETELLRARTLPKEKDADTRELLYPDTAAILLASAQYWETTGADRELSNARYRELLHHFPESNAALAATRSNASAVGTKGL